MGVVARRFVASPGRSSSKAWQAITQLVAAKDSKAGKQFEAIQDHGALIINSQAPESQPIVIKGAGSQLKIYCLYGEDAMDGEDANEDPLSWNPFVGDWHVHLPCQEDEMSWLEGALRGEPRFSVYNAKEGYDRGLIADKSEAAVEINLGGLRKL